MNKFLRKFIVLLIIPSFLNAAEEATSAQRYNLGDLAYPTDVKDLGKQGGSIYYSAPSKNKALIPTHIWGEVGRPGMHFIPVDSSLVKALSYAGGVGSGALLGEVKVNREMNGKNETFEFDMEEGGGSEAHHFAVQPGDTIYVPRNRFYENRAYYTSLISVGVTILSAILIYRQVKRDPQK